MRQPKVIVYEHERGKGATPQYLDALRRRGLAAVARNTVSLVLPRDRERCDAVVHVTEGSESEIVGHYAEAGVPAFVAPVKVSRSVVNAVVAALLPPEPEEEGESKEPEVSP